MMYQILAITVICLTTGSLTDGFEKRPTPFEVWLEGPGRPGPVYSSPNHGGAVFKYIPRIWIREKLRNQNEPERHFLEAPVNDEENELFPEEKKAEDVEDETPSSDGVSLDNESDAEFSDTRAYFYQPAPAKLHKESSTKKPKTSKPMKRFPRSVEVSRRRKRSTIESDPKPMIHDDAADEQVGKKLHQKHKYKLTHKTSGIPIVPHVELNTEPEDKINIRGNNNKYQKLHHHAQLNREKSEAEPLVTKVTISSVPEKIHKVDSASEEWRGDGKKRTQVETELGDYHEENSSDYASYSSEELGEDTDAHYENDKHGNQKSRTRKLKSSNKKYGSGKKHTESGSKWLHHKIKAARISSAAAAELPVSSSPSGYCKLHGVYENDKGQIISGTGGCTDEPLKFLHAPLTDDSAIVFIDGIAKEYKIGSKIPFDLDNVKNSVWTVNGKLQHCSKFGLYEKLINSHHVCLKPLDEEESMQAYEYGIKGLHKMGKLAYKGKHVKRTKLPWISYAAISPKTHRCPQDAPPC